MIELVDTHCHIHFDNYPLDIRQVITSAVDTGVRKMICVGCSLADSRLATRLAVEQSGIWAAAGAHPHGAEDFLATDDSLSELNRLLSEPKVVAVGEIGLDYYRLRSPKSQQQQALRAQIEAGLSSGLPIIFHVRDAWKDFWQIFDSYPKLRGEIHSFSADRSQLDQALSRGLYVGLNGIMTFTSDNEQLAAAKAIPLTKLLLETDAPFLTPAPFRGKTCEPAHVLQIAKFLADLRNERLENLVKVTTANAASLFGLESKK